MSQSIAILLAAGTGVAIAVQATANSRLNQSTGQPFWAAYFSILGTIAFSTLVMLALRPEAPSMEAIRATQWWQWIGGPLGALIVLAGALLVPHLGSAKFIAFVVAGQLLASILLDHFSLMGLPFSSASIGKIVGALLVVAGVICIKFL